MLSVSIVTRLQNNLVSLNGVAGLQATEKKSLQFILSSFEVGDGQSSTTARAAFSASSVERYAPALTTAWILRSCSGVS
jgi:hypothetical protein